MSRAPKKGLAPFFLTQIKAFILDKTILDKAWRQPQLNINPAADVETITDAPGLQSSTP
ncbi:MAG: hypothetical protein WBA57_19305 [Elainellaceae cyanobacterium]